MSKSEELNKQEKNSEEENEKCKCSDYGLCACRVIREEIYRTLSS